MKRRQPHNFFLKIFSYSQMSAIISTMLPLLVVVVVKIPKPNSDKQSPQSAGTKRQCKDQSLQVPSYLTPMLPPMLNSCQKSGTT